MSSTEKLLQATLNRLRVRIAKSLVNTAAELAVIANEAPERLQQEWEIFQEEVLAEASQLENETKAENVDSVFSEELASEIAAFEEDLEVEAEKIVYQDYFVENVASDNSTETVGDLIFIEDLSIETEAEEEISGISEEHGNSLYAGEKSEHEIPDEGIEVQTNDEQVIQYNYWEIEETDSAEESGEKIDACEGEFSEKVDGTQKNNFTTEEYSHSEFRKRTKQVRYK